MPKLFYTGTPDKDPVPAASKKPCPPPGALRLPAGGDGRPPKHIQQQQQQQQQRKDKMNDDNKTKKKLYDSVERAPPIQNNSSYNTTSSSFLLQPNNDNNESTMILSLLNQETILPNANNQPKEALLSSLTSWHEFGIFMQGGGGVNNNNKNDDDDDDGEEKEEEQLLFHMVSNSIPKQQQQQEGGDEEQQNNNNNGNDNEVIIIEDNTSEESFHTATSATSTRQRRDNNVAAPPIIHTSNVSKQTTTKKNHDEERYSQRTNDVVDARTRNSGVAAAAAVAPPIIHTSTVAKQTTTKTNVDEERSSQQIYGVEEDARRRNPDGIVNPQVQQPKRPLLGYKGMEWDEKNGVWVPTVHGREQVPAQNPAKTTATTTTADAESQSSMKVTAGAPNSQFVAQGSTVPPDALPPTNTIALSSKPVESDEVPKPAAVTASEQQQAVVVAQRAVYEAAVASQQSAAAIQDALQKQQQQQVPQRQLNQQQQSHRYERPSTAQQVLLGAGASAHESTAPLIDHVLMGASAESTAVIQHLRQQLQQQQLLTTHWFLQQQQLQQQQQQQQQLQQMSQLRHVVTRTVNNVQTGHGTGGATNNNNRAATSAPAPPIPANSTNARSGSNNNDKSGGLPDLERWSEYRIDAAKSITELELIRRRLLTLVEKTNSRLKEMRVQRALGNELGVKGAEKLSIKELIDMLSEQVEEESSGNVVGEGLTTTATARKRNHSEMEEQSPPTKRQRCCPLCLGTSHLQSETDSSGAAQGLTATRNVTCSICEDDGICSKCSSRCLKCFKSICADCFATCSKCNSSSYCSDCVDGGNGKCATCWKSEERAQKRREKRAAEKKRKEPPPPPARAQPFVEPGQTIVPDVEDEGFEFKLPSPRRKPRGNDSLAKLPPPVPTQITVRPPNEAESKSSETSYAEHRFLISGDIVKIGLSLKHQLGRVTLVDIEKNSLAEKHGVQEGDVLVLPGVVSVETWKLFIAAASQPRPMIFHVQRSCSKPSDDSTVHRFVVHERGKLGVKIKKVGDTCMISYIYPGSLAEKHGICKNDILCKPFTNGSEIEGLYDWFLNMAKSNTRPFVIEVFRKKSVAPPPCYSFGDENPFLYRISEESSAVEEADNENGNAASAADHENKNAAPAPVYNLLSSASEESRSPPPLE